MTTISNQQSQRRRQYASDSSYRSTGQSTGVHKRAQAITVDRSRRTVDLTVDRLTRLGSRVGAVDRSVDRDLDRSTGRSTGRQILIDFRILF